MKWELDEKRKDIVFVAKAMVYPHDGELAIHTYTSYHTGTVAVLANVWLQAMKS